MNELLYIKLLLFVSVFLSAHGLLTLIQMLYGWLHVQTIDKNSVPKIQRGPKTFFSLIVPCKNEEKVIRQTLIRLLDQSYEKNLYEIIVSLQKNDTKTIEVVKDIIFIYPNRNVSMVIFEGENIHKSHHLNKALEKAKGDYVGVFDAEDDVHPQLLSSINTIILDEGRKIIQTGVSLSNWNSNWYSLHVAIEYYFWFHSRLQWFAEKGIVPLGGIGLFLPNEIITQVGGWDETCLTEDAKLGLDCSIAKYEFRIFSQEDHATKEEIPTSIFAFIRQRTRWLQGFLQIIFSWKWRKLTLDQQVYFLSLFLFPFLQIALFVWFIVCLYISVKLPVVVVLIAFIPLALLLFQICVQLAGVFEMLMQRKQVNLFPIALILFFVTYIFYQIVLMVSAVRAIIRYLQGNFGWEKTTHINKHRTGVPTI